MQIAIFSKNPELIRSIDNIAVAHQYVTRSYGDDLSMIRALRSESFVLMLVDAALRYSSHHIVCQWRQSHGCRVPLLVAGMFRDARDMQAALDADAADIVVGPLDNRELATRMRRVVQRIPHARSAEVIRHGRYTLDAAACHICLDDVVIPLTAREYQLAALLLTNPGVNFSREQLSRVIWSSTREVAERSLEQYIYRLRKKLRLSPDTGAVLRTLYAQGYRLEIAPVSGHTGEVDGMRTETGAADLTASVVASG